MPLLEFVILALAVIFAAAGWVTYSRSRSRVSVPAAGLADDGWSLVLWINAVMFAVAGVLLLLIR